MRHRITRSVLGVVVTTGVGVFSLAVMPRTDQARARQTPVAQSSTARSREAPRSTFPRLAGKPNLNGIWQTLNTANWNIQDHPAQPGVISQFGAIGAVPAGQGVVEGNALPYQPWAAVKQNENFANRLKLDPEAKCYMPGVPRATYLPFPFQIVQGGSDILMAYEFASTTRVVHMDKHEEPPTDSWMGWSNGHWDGDTLVVDVTGFNDKSWFDRAGNFHSDALHVIERYTPLSPDALSYEVTIEDPKVFTRPWKMSMPLYRRLEPRAQLLEFKCVEFAEELLYGDLRKKPSN